MNSFEEIEKDLELVEKSEAAAWTKYPPTPKWFYALIGLSEGFLVASIIGTPDSDELLSGAMLLAGLLIFGATFGLYVKHRGQFPSCKPPKEIRSAMARGVALMLLPLGLVAFLALTKFWFLCPIVGLILFAISGAIYEPIYNKAAAETNSRLSL